MRAVFVLFLMLLMCPLVSASYDWVYQSSKATFVVEITEHARVILFENSRMESAKGILDFFPRDDARQTTETMITFPDSNTVGDSLVYSWDKPTDTDLTFSMYSHVSTKNYMVKVTKKVDFPALIVEPELAKYTEPTLAIDSANPDVKRIASTLAEGDDDYYDVVFRFADWVNHNIGYKSTDDTAQFSQKASWVLQNKYGVCDEMTNLFIAMCRSVGIPAKYVSGYAYGKDGPGPHAWAEVYIPGFGWVPFDPTYAEFGSVDISHIKLKDSVDAGVPSSRYEWKGKNAELDTSELVISTDVLATEGKVLPLISITLKPLSQQMATNSYNYVEAVITNDNPFYVAAKLEAQVPSQAQVYPVQQNVLLKPHENKSVYWKISIGHLPSEYTYTIPFVIYLQGNYSISTDIIAEKGSPAFSLSEIDQLLAEKEYVRPVFNSKLLLRCLPKYKQFYPDEPLLADCLVMNSGSVNLPSVYVCHESDCQTLSLGVGDKAKLDFQIPNRGSATLKFKAVAGDFTAEDSVAVTVVDLPRVQIGELEHPGQISFDLDYFIKFLLNKKSQENPRQMIVILDSKDATKSWDLAELNESTDFIAEMKGTALRSGNNEVKIFVSYYDQHNRRYDDQRNAVIKLQNLTMGNRLVLWWDSVKNWF